MKKYICPKCQHQILLDPSAIEATGNVTICPECQSTLTIIGDYAYIPLPDQPLAQETPPPFSPDEAQDEPYYPSIAEVTGAEHDPLYNDAIGYVRTCSAISVPMLARYFNIPIERASHLMSDLEKGGIVGPYNQGGPREIRIEHSSNLPSGQRRTFDQDQKMKDFIEQYKQANNGQEPKVRTVSCSCSLLILLLILIMFFSYFLTR